MDQAQQLRNIIKTKNQARPKHARVITVTSGKGGVGKSNVSVNLALWFSRLGKKVIIFDADFGLANIEVMFGVVPKHNLSDVIYRGKNIKDVITQGPENIGFISGGSGVVGLNSLNMGQISFLLGNLTELDSLADIIIIDTGAGVSESVLEFVLSSPEVIVVTTPDPSSLTDAYSLLKTLFANPNFKREECNVKVVSNRVRHEVEGKSVFDKLDSVVRQFLSGNIEYLGMIPQDSLLERAVRQQKPVSLLYPDAKSSQSFEVLVRKLSDLPVNQTEKKGITHLLAEVLKRRNA